MTKTIDNSRRKFIKSSTAVAGALAMPMIMTSNKARAAPTELNMLAWYGHGEADVVGAYEEANNVKFNKKYYAGGDNMLALVSQSPPGTYDIILSDAEFVMQLNEAGYIEELDAADYNFDDMLHEDLKKFPGHWKDDKLFSVMVRFGHLGVVQLLVEAGASDIDAAIQEATTRGHTIIANFLRGYRRSRWRRRVTRAYSLALFVWRSQHSPLFETMDAYETLTRVLKRALEQSPSSLSTIEKAAMTVSTTQRSTTTTATTASRVSTKRARKRRRRRPRRR